MPSGAARAAEGAAPALSDEAVVARVLAGERALFEIVLRRYNQRLFRTLRAMVRDDAEAEDILQETYVRAYRHLAQFAGRASFATWLTRIAIHEALARRRKSGRFTSLGDADRWQAAAGSPEESASTGELRAVLERALGQLPENLRLVVVLRDVQGLATDEAAACLGITPDNVKVRLHCARALLRDKLERQWGAQLRQLHRFDGERCDRMVASVLNRIDSECILQGGTPCDAPPDSA